MFLREVDLLGSQDVQGYKGQSPPLVAAQKVDKSRCGIGSIDHDVEEGVTRNDLERSTVLIFAGEVFEQGAVNTLDIVSAD